MASSRSLDKTAAFFKLVVAIVVMGVISAAFFVPYVLGAGLVTRAATDKFLNATCDLTETPLAQSSTVYARDGKTVIATLFSDNRQVLNSLTLIPKTVQRALIDTEDRRFYSHHGVDTRGLLRAALNESDGATQGASTLTQQYVKQVRLYQATTDAERAAAIAQTGARKITEAKCALQLEKKYSKDQILLKYFNIAYFGEQSYGIAVAAHNYFGTTPAKLTVPQAAVLVGLVKNPTDYDPFIDPKAAKDRRDVVIQNMAKEGDITQAQSAAYQRTSIVLANQSTRTSQGCSFSNDKAIRNVGFFCDYAINWLTSTGGLTATALQTGGYKIVTSIDPGMQNQAQNSMFSQFPATSPTTAVQPAIDPRNGEIMAMVTNKLYDYGQTHTKDSRYTTVPIFSSAYSGSGSTYKYFALIAALNAGVQPSQVIYTPFTNGTTYLPRNCGDPRGGMANAGRYADRYTLRQATEASSNTFFVGLEDQLFGCDLSPIVNTAITLGMDALTVKGADGRSVAERVEQDRSFTFTLGQESTSAIELADAYSAAAGDGVLSRPRPILSITGPGGTPVAFKQATRTQVMSPWVARTAVDIMKGDTQGSYCTACEQFGTWYGQGGSQVAGKTGTNNASDDGVHDNGKNAALWFVGLTPTLTAVSALVNVSNPTQTISGLPGIDDGTAQYNAFGAIAAGYWVSSFGPYLLAHPWTWPDASAIADNQIQVPSLVGDTEPDAIAQLKALGLNPKRYEPDCGSSVFLGNVAYNGPGVAVPGQTVYYCISSGQPLLNAPVLRRPTTTPTRGTPRAPVTPAPPTVTPTRPRLR